VSDAHDVDVTMGGSGQLVASNGRSSLVDGAEQTVRRWLSSGRFRSGDRLPPEQELAGMLGVSRGTLRSALRRLEETGEIVRRQGSGTYVGTMGPPGGLVSGALRVDSYRLGADGGYSVRELTIERGDPGEAAARALGIAPGDTVTHLWRTATTGGKVTAAAEDVFHPRLVLPEEPELRQMLLAPVTVWEMLAGTSTPPAISRTRISPLLLSPEDELGARLELRVPTACLALEEVACSADAEPLLWSWDVFAPGGFELEVLQSAVSMRPDRVAGRPAPVGG
jgi:DNA-binding GntR family transcriptional regulator